MSCVACTCCPNAATSPNGSIPRTTGPTRINYPSPTLTTAHSSTTKSADRGTLTEQAERVDFRPLVDGCFAGQQLTLPLSWLTGDQPKLAFLCSYSAIEIIRSRRVSHRRHFKALGTCDSVTRVTSEKRCSNFLWHFSRR